MKKIKTVKIKNEDGSIGEESYFLSTDANIVNMNNGYSVEDTIGNINIEQKGNIANQLNNLNNNINNLNNGVNILNNNIKKKIYYFNTVADMINADLKAGDFVYTLGYYEPNDGGGAEYRIVNNSSSIVVNNIDKFLIENNNCVAFLNVEKKSLNILQLGCKGDNIFDNTTRIQYGINEYNDIYIPQGKFLITNTIIYKRYTKIIGENKINSIIIMSPTVEKTILQSDNFNTFKNNPSPYWQWDDRTCCFFEFQNFRIDGNYRNANNEVLKSSGNGINNYGASYIINNVCIDNCPGIGFFNQWTNPTTGQAKFRAGNQIARIDIDINNCGEEGLINDLGDSQFNRLFMGNCGIKGISTYKDDNTCCHSVILNKGCEIGEWHVYGGTKGYGVFATGETRLRAQSLIIESCCGGLYIDNANVQGEISNLQMHNMMYMNSNYEGEFHYLDFNSSRPLLISNCKIQEVTNSTDLALIQINNSGLNIYNLYCIATLYKTKPAIIGNYNDERYFGRTTIKGTVENCPLVLANGVGNSCNIELNVINCTRVVQDDFVIGVGSKVKFTGQLYTNQKFSDNLLTTTPRKGCFEMNMRIDGVDNIYPGVTNVITPDLSTENTNKYNSLSYNLPFKLDPNDLVLYMYKLSEGNWGNVNISIVTRDQQVNQTTGIPYAPIKYIYSGTAPTGHDYRIIGKYGK